jgi:iron complex transport system permease protein
VPIDVASGAPGQAPAAGRGHRATGRRPAATLFGTLLLLALAATLSLAVGSHPLSPTEVWHALSHPDAGQAGTIVRDVRLPRTVLGLLVGLALGASGALMQGHTRNPLADPGLFGVSAGAALAVVIGVFAFAVTDPATTARSPRRGAVRRARCRSPSPAQSSRRCWPR